MTSPPILRTPTRATGGLTDEERDRLEVHTRTWIRRALRTDPIEPDKIVPAIEALYAAAELAKPRVVIVPSPLVMAFAYGAASALLANGAAPDVPPAVTGLPLATTLAADRARVFDAFFFEAMDAAMLRETERATKEAVAVAADRSTHLAVHRGLTMEAYRGEIMHNMLHDVRTPAADAVEAATDSATRGAAMAATIDAVNAAVRAAGTSVISIPGPDAADSPWHGAEHACRSLAGDDGLTAATRWHDAHQGGNTESGWDCFLTACRDILGLRLPELAGYAAWEACAIHGGFRVMHPAFCMVSNFPESLCLDAANRPHAEHGPSHRWRDGWSLYHWHGVRVPAAWIEDRASLAPDIARNWPDFEQRRAAYDMLGMEMAEASPLRGAASGRMASP